MNSLMHAQHSTHLAHALHGAEHAGGALLGVALAALALKLALWIFNAYRVSWHQTFSDPSPTNPNASGISPKAPFWIRLLTYTSGSRIIDLTPAQHLKARHTLKRLRYSNLLAQALVWSLITYGCLPELKAHFQALSSSLSNSLYLQTHRADPPPPSGKPLDPETLS